MDMLKNMFTRTPVAEQPPPVQSAAAPAAGRASVSAPQAAPSASDPQAAEDWVPDGPFTLRAVPLPDNYMSYSNKVFISKRQAKILPHRLETYFLLENKLVYVVGVHDAVKPGEIAISNFQRDQLGLPKVSSDSPTVSVNLSFFDPAAEERFDIVELKVTAEYKRDQVCKGSEAEMTPKILSSYQNHVFTVGQFFPFDFYNGRWFKMRVTGIKTAARRGPAGAEVKTDLSSDFCSPAERGILSIAGCKIEIDVIPNKFLQWQAAKRMSIPEKLSFKELGIGGLDEQFETIFRRAFTPRLFPQKVLQQLGQKHPKGILLYGPPGTGKTLIAREIGKLFNTVEPKVVNGPEILSKYVGEAEKSIRDLFAPAEADYAKNGENAELHLIIFDEIDAICKQRGSGRGDAGVGDSIVNMLLSKMDGLKSLNNILVIGMTNRKDMLDEALLRPGRFEIPLEISLPDVEGRQQILEIHIKTIKANGRLADDVNVKELAEITKNFSGAELEGLVRAAVSISMFGFVRKDQMGKPIDEKTAEGLVISMEHFLRALRQKDVKAAFGRAEKDLNERVTEGIIVYGPKFAALMEEARTLITQTKKNTHTPLLSILLDGPAGSGKTAIAARLALESDLPYARIVGPENLIGCTETQKVNIISKAFDDAYRSPQSIVILDNLERIIEYSPIGFRYSNALLQALMVLLQRAPSDGRRLMVVATCSNFNVLEQLELADLFNFVLQVPQIESEEEARAVIVGLGVPVVAHERDQITSLIQYPISVKRLITILRISAQDVEEQSELLTADHFAKTMSLLTLRSK